MNHFIKESVPFSGSLAWSDPGSMVIRLKTLSLRFVIGDMTLLMLPLENFSENRDETRYPLGDLGSQAFTPYGKKRKFNLVGAP